MATGARYTETLTNNNGDVLRGATVYAVDKFGNTVTLYSNEGLTTSIGTSATSDYNGLVDFYLQEGTYDIVQVFGGTTKTLSQVKLFRPIISVKDFSAKGDGSTDDTTAITNADAYARNLGAILHFPAGTYIASQLTLYTGSNWQGEGRDSTTIKSLAGSNKDLLYGVNSSSCWGSTTPTGFANGFTLRNLTLDGNKANNSAGSGLAAFVAKPIIEDIYIKNCAEYGMRTEYYDSSLGTDTWAMEGYFSNIRIDTVGKHGWLNNGPHDSVAVNVIIIDAGQASSNTYDGFYLGNRSGMRHIACHAWTRSTSVRMHSALNIISGSAGSEFTGGCNFEGGYTANVIVSGNNCLFDPSTRYYAAWNGTNILLTGTGCTANTIMGKLHDPGSGRPACVGLQIGSAVSDYVSDNVIELHMVAQESTNFAWSANNTGGNNRIRGKTYNTTTSSITGNPAVTDDVDIMINNSSGLSHINNRRQKTTKSIGSNTSVSWTFPYAFAVSPIVTFSPASPSAAITSGMWVSALGATSVTIFNNSGVTATVHIVAEAVT